MFTCRVVAVAVSLALLNGCAAISLRPAVQSASLDYATVFEEFNNQGILRNILRASDNAPLSFADLPILHGSLNMQTTLGISDPFGPIHGSSGINTFTAGLQFTSNPTFDTNPLNTSGFSLEVIQPVSPTFVVAAWQSGVPKELLLRLFVESIEFTKDKHRYLVPNKPNCGNRVKKADGCEIKQGLDSTFLTLMERALKSQLDLRLFTFYLPLGAAGKPKAAKDIVDLATATGETNIHLGNGANGDLEVFRTLPGFVLGCLNLDAFNNDSIDIGDGPETNPHFKIEEMKSDQTKIASRHAAAARHTTAEPRVVEPKVDSTRHVAETSPSSEGINGIEDSARIATDFGVRSGLAAMALKKAVAGGEKTASAGSKTSPSASQQSAVQPGQISSIVGQKNCLRDTIVLPPATELQSSEDGEQGIIIHWRSIASVIRYVGAIVAEQGDGAVGVSDPKWSWPSDSGGASREILFSAARNAPRARVAVDYQGEMRGVQPAIRPDGTRDDSLMVMALLTQLLNDSRIAGDIPTTQRLEIVP